MNSAGNDWLGVPPSRRWRAKWIWEGGDGRTPNVYCLFRAEIRLGDVPDDLRLFIAADTRYQLYINGRFVARGAPQSQPYFQYYDEHAVARHLAAGPNCVGVIVNYVGNLVDTRGGLLAELTDGDGKTLLATDERWRVLRARAWREDTFRARMNTAAPFQEHFDARKLPHGWDTPGFEDAGWSAASVIHGRHSDRPPAVAPWSFLLARDIPPMTADPVLPVRIERVEECTDLMNRTRSEDLSIGLSMPGAQVRHSVVEGAQNLCAPDGTTVLRCSVLHRDRVYDGRHDPCLTLDFGRVVTAYPRIEIDGVAGAVLDIGYAERLIDGHFNNALEGQFADRCVMTAGPQVFQPFHWRAFRYLRLRLRQCEEPVTIRSLQAVVSTFPFEERGHFRSGDELLNRVFDISRYTLRLCSNEFLMDTPWREQAQWLGDIAAVTLGGLYACFGDTELSGKFLRQSGANQFATGMLSNISNSISHAWQGCIPDYSLWWVMGLWDHYLYTGDEGWIRELYPVAHRVIQAHFKYVNEFGLIEDMPYWVFIDWADVDRRGECAAYNALFYGALEAFGKMAEMQGDAHTREQVRRLRALMREHFQARLYDPGRGCFADARVDGQLSPKTSEHASVAAVRWGLCDGETAAGIVRRFYEADAPPFVAEAQPFFTTVVLQALDRAGRFDLALQLIRDRWGERMIEKGATSTYEEWGVNNSWRSGEFQPIMRTLSHAWSACPAEFLIRGLIGLEILEPGCARVRLDPRPAGFDFDVTFPTPRGPIRVRSGNGSTHIDAPAGVTVVRADETGKEP